MSWVPGMTGGPLLSVRHLSVSLGKRKVLHDVSLDLAANEIVTIVGPNGSGKSTLLRAIIGAQAPSGGTILRAPDLRVGYVPQTLRIDPTLPMSVGRFLELSGGPGLRLAPADALADLGQPGISDRQMADLSGGQLQRALLAAAVQNRPHVLLLDEPTQGLDQPGAAAFYRRIEALRADLGCAVLMVSHDLHVVMAASDRVICLNGHICCAGAPAQVASAPAYRALFGSGTQGALALYRHEHTHSHDQPHDA